MSLHQPNCSGAPDDHEVFCAASFMLARLGWTILGALGSQGARQPHLGGTRTPHRERQRPWGKWYHLREIERGLKVGL